MDRDDPLHDLVAECLARLERDGDAGVESVLREHPQVAGQLRERLARLRDLGLAGGPSPPSSIGPYRILDVLGEGGMGIVYLAEQREPIRRRVALKLIKLGLATKEVIARFEVERQALAMMNHPNIAKVFDAGATPQGQPFFAMEHVPGVPITDYCDRQKLGMGERLSLFLQVCRAVQHAHQNGVMHRDLKPSNILVQLQDQTPLAKIIDFGIAKATNHQLTAQTVFTEQGRIIGTPEYMSPEQAEMTGLSVDIRTDVYSLGVVLYELLTGALPFDRHALRRAGYLEIQRVIREVEPERPSTRVSTNATAADAAQCRVLADGKALARALLGDLDWITMRALEKDPARRYQSASQLALDVERHLRHEPVEAGPPSLAYKVSRFVRRERRLLTAAGAVGLALLAGWKLASLMDEPKNQPGSTGVDPASQALPAYRWERFPELGIEFESLQGLQRIEPLIRLPAERPLVARFQSANIGAHGTWGLDLLQFDCEGPEVGGTDPFEQWITHGDPLRRARRIQRRPGPPPNAGGGPAWDYRDDHELVTGIESRHAASTLRIGPRLVALVVHYPLRKATHVPSAEEERAIATLLGTLRVLGPPPDAAAADGWDFVQKGNHITIYSWLASEDPGPSRALAVAIADILDGAVPACLALLPEPDRGIANQKWIVRVCADRPSYERRGGLRGLGVFFDQVSGDLVVAGDEKPGDRLRLQILHEMWHQVTFRYFGGVTPHLWYDEGMADYLASHVRAGGDDPSWRPAPREDRRATMLAMLARKATIPLVDLMRMERGDAYRRGLNFFSQSYALAAYFSDLDRPVGSSPGGITGRPESPAMRYARALRRTHDAEAALEEAVVGVDWPRIQADWGEWVRRDLYQQR